MTFLDGKLLKMAFLDVLQNNIGKSIHIDRPPEVLDQNLELLYVVYAMQTRSLTFPRHVIMFRLDIK